MSFASIILAALHIMLGSFSYSYSRYNEEKASFKLPIVIPVIMVIIQLFLGFTPIIAKPSMQYLYGALLALAGLIFYFIFIRARVRFTWYEKATVWIQILLNVAQPAKDV